MSFIEGLFKDVGNAVTGGLAGAAGNFVSGLFSDKDDPKKNNRVSKSIRKRKNEVPK